MFISESLCCVHHAASENLLRAKSLVHFARQFRLPKDVKDLIFASGQFDLPIPTRQFQFSKDAAYLISTSGQSEFPISGTDSSTIPASTLPYTAVPLLDLREESTIRDGSGRRALGDLFAEAQKCINMRFEEYQRRKGFRFGHCIPLAQKVPREKLDGVHPKSY